MQTSGYATHLFGRPFGTKELSCRWYYAIGSFRWFSELYFVRPTPLDYAIHVSKFGQRPKGIVWPILLKQRLPKIQTPLRPSDADVEIDLGKVLNTAYERAGYDMIIDYAQLPFVPLDDANTHWAKEWLKRYLPLPVHASA